MRNMTVHRAFKCVDNPYIITLDRLCDCESDCPDMSDETYICECESYILIVPGNHGNHAHVLE